jgi:hypothetical protein
MASEIIELAAPKLRRRFPENEETRRPPRPCSRLMVKAFKKRPTSPASSGVREAFT